MPKPRKAGRFGGSPGHHHLMMANLATELFRHGRIRTTHAKAKTVQPIAERVITLAKRGDLHSRRQVMQTIRDRDIVHKLFTDVGPAFTERNGGYTRVLKLGPRKGDAAPMALIELLDAVGTTTADAADETARRRWSLRRRRDERVPETPAADVSDADVDEADDETEASDVDRGDAKVPVAATAGAESAVLDRDVEHDDDAEADDDVEDVDAAAEADDADAVDADDEDATSA